MPARGDKERMSAPVLFDRELLRRRLARAASIGAADFLLVRAAEDLADRLRTVLRPFGSALDLGTPGPQAVEALRADGRPERIVQAAPIRAALARGVSGFVADPALLAARRESVDLIVSLLALQTVDDLPGTLIQARQALRPDGLFVGCLLGGATLQELRQAFMQAESEIEGGASPRVAPFADVRDAGALLQRAGFALPVTDIDTVVVRHASPFGLMRDLRAMGGANALVARRREPLRRATLLRAAEIYAERFSDPDGKVRATFEIVWLSGWAPHASQQKPLRPGTAAMRLADALRTEEKSAGEKPGEA